MDNQKGEGQALVEHPGVPLQLSYHAEKVMPAALEAGYELARCCLADLNSMAEKDLVTDSRRGSW